MFIIIEGVDGSGKSTLAEKLVKMYDGTEPTLLHKGPIQADTYDEYVKPLLITEDLIKPHAVADRWHLGELVYGPKYRGESRLTFEQLEWMEMFLESRGAVRLYMATPEDTVIERLSQRGDDMVKVDDVHDLLVKYERIIRIMPQYLYVTPTEAADDNILAKLVFNATARTRRFRKLDRIPSYVGTLAPDVLVAFDGDDPVAGFPRDLDSPGWWAIRGLWNTRRPSPGWSYGFVNSSELGEATVLLNPGKVIYAMNIPRPMVETNAYLEGVLA